jgi:hypothetical protein
MSSEPKKILTMAELLRAAKLKKEKENSEENTLPPSTIVSSTIQESTIPNSTIVQRGRASKTPVSENKTRYVRIDSTKGYFPYFNDLSDRIIPELKLLPIEQAVLHRLYRLSRGWKSEECTIGLGGLAKACVMSKTSVQKAIALLIEKGLIEDLGASKKGDKNGKRYRVLPGLTMVRSTIVNDTIVNRDSTIPLATTEVRDTIVPDTNNKNSNKEYKNNTQTQDDVRVGSRYSLSDCRKYAEHLKATGQGITNPGGYATKIHRSGEADEMIEAFLNPPPVQTSVDASQCPDCQGTGWWYPKGREAGAAKCKHERLRD